MKYLIQFKHPDSTPLERKWIYCTIELGDDTPKSRIVSQCWYMAEQWIWRNFQIFIERDAMSEIREVI